MSAGRGAAAGVALRKRRLRAEMREARRGLPSEVVLAARAAVVQHWRAIPELSRAARVALYAALPEELPTRPLFEHLRREGREVLLPRCGRERLEFVPVRAWAELRPGILGIPEPPEHLAPASLGASDPVLVPGLAFDRAGNRLGQGRAYYDRTFAEADRPRLIGAGFALQVVAQVPREEWDRRVGALLTERGFTRVPERTA